MASCFDWAAMVASLSTTDTVFRAAGSYIVLLTTASRRLRGASMRSRALRARVPYTRSTLAPYTLPLFDMRHWDSSGEYATEIWSREPSTLWLLGSWNTS